MNLKNMQERKGSTRNLNLEYLTKEKASGRKSTGAIISSKKKLPNEPTSELFTGKFSNTYGEGTIEFPVAGVSTPANNVSHRKTFNH